MSLGGSIRRLLSRSRPAALGLRRRILLTITLGSIALSMFLAITTYGLTQNNLVRQAEESAVKTSLRNAQSVENNLRSNPPTAQPAVDSLTRIGVQRYLIRYGDQWVGGVTPYVETNLPPAIVDNVLDKGEPSQQIVLDADESLRRPGIALARTPAEKLPVNAFFIIHPLKYSLNKYSWNMNVVWI